MRYYVRFMGAHPLLGQTVFEYYTKGGELLREKSNMKKSIVPYSVQSYSNLLVSL